MSDARCRETGGRPHRPHKVLGSASLLALLTTSVVSSGAPAKTADPEPALPPPQVTLKVTPDAIGGPWRLHIENTGEGPVRIPADPRLLVLELTPPASAEPEPKAKKAPAGPTTLRCILPADARPATDEGRELVVPTKRSWSASFDPLFYCFGPRERAALVAGTSVKARFGWQSPQPRPGAKPGTTRAPAPPLAVMPVGASVGKIAPAKELEAAPFTLAEAVTVPKDGDKPKGESATGGEEAPAAVTLSVPEAVDAANGSELATTVTLTNGTDRPITLLYRPDMVQFGVSGPGGSVSCGSPRSVAAPIRELFITVPAKGKTSASVLFTTTCPGGTFDEPGIYRVTPRLDTTGASGRPIGLATWDGYAAAKAPLLVRVRSPRKPALPARPTLD